MNKVRVNLALCSVGSGRFFQHFIIFKLWIYSIYRDSLCFLNTPRKLLLLLVLIVPFDIDATTDNMNDEQSNLFASDIDTYVLSFSGFSIADVKVVEAYFIQHSGYVRHEFEVLAMFDALMRLNIQSEADEIAFILQKIFATTDLKVHIATTANTISITMIESRRQSQRKVPKGVW